MRAILCFIVFSLILSTVNSQALTAKVFVGISNYQGDLQPKVFTFNQSHLAVGAGLGYLITNRINLRGMFTWGQLSADDKSSSRNAARNLNFKSDIWEIQLAGEYHFRDPQVHRFSPYAFAGVALFHFNPYTADPSGHKHFLQPLRTEGEGIVPGVKKYSTTQFSIPMGVGVKYTLLRTMDVGLEFGFRKTFTDYIDDVSGKYADPNVLRAANGDLAVQLAFRGNEINEAAPYPPVGSKRGEATKKDWYYFAGVMLAFRFNGGSDGKSKKGKHQYDCPPE
jgi:opacity protein-like surface antigen